MWFRVFRVVLLTGSQYAYVVSLRYCQNKQLTVCKLSKSENLFSNVMAFVSMILDVVFVSDL